jgi:hypothetical protein
MQNLYTAYGITMKSVVLLDAVQTTPLDGEATLQISERMFDAEPSHNLTSKSFASQVDDNGTYISVKSLLDIWISNGSSILFRRTTSTTDDDIRAFIQQPALSLVLQQRGVLVFRGSTVELNGKALPIIGHPLSGKSTIAALLMKSGCRVISDGICAFSFDSNGRFRALSGIPVVYLWPDSIEYLGSDHSSFRRIRGSLDSRIWPIFKDFCPHSVPVECVLYLDNAIQDEPRPYLVSKAVAISLLRSKPVCPSSYISNGYLNSYLDISGRFGGSIKLYHLKRPKCFSQLDAIIETLRGILSQ